MEVQPAVEPRLSEVDEVVSGDWQLLSVELDFERTHGRLYGCSLWHVKSVGQILVVSTNGIYRAFLGERFDPECSIGLWATTTPHKKQFNPVCLPAHVRHIVATSRVVVPYIG